MELLYGRPSRTEPGTSIKSCQLQARRRRPAGARAARDGAGPPPAPAPCAVHPPMRSAGDPRWPGDSDADARGGPPRRRRPAAPDMRPRPGQGAQDGATAMRDVRRAVAQHPWRTLEVVFMLATTYLLLKRGPSAPLRSSHKCPIVPHCHEAAGAAAADVLTWGDVQPAPSATLSIDTISVGQVNRKFVYACPGYKILQGSRLDGLDHAPGRRTSRRPWRHLQIQGRKSAIAITRDLSM